jgi:hypothetical protein
MCQVYEGVKRFLFRFRVEAMSSFGGGETGLELIFG